jgi:uncharacterized protein YmfQ (DUF2313 family)
MRDRHVRRSGSDYLHALLALLPVGYAWPRHPESTLVKTLAGLAEFWGFVDGRAADLLERESDPRQTIELLPDWERNWGLPDPCFFFDGGDMAGRRKTLMHKMTMIGGQSRAFFTDVLNELGYSADIKEFSPFMVGISRCGYTFDENGDQIWRIGPPEMRFYWTVQPGHVSLTWFRVDAGQAAIDPHLRMGYPEDAICLLEKWKPAHTVIVPDYSGDSGTSDPMAGTP